jgi:hypothetical protein
MTIQEIQERFEFGEIRPPRKGELILSRPNHMPTGDKYEPVLITRNFKRISCQILTPKFEFA